jgi:acetyl esterase/lipase
LVGAARSARAATMLLSAVLMAAACGNDDAADRRFEVTSEVVSHETTQDVSVFAPDAEGSGPVVVVTHGTDGSGEDMAELATRLARVGLVVFAPTYRTDLSTQERLVEAVRDLECGYRFVRSIAGDYGGDLDQPVTFVGWSLGATWAIQGGLTEQIDPSGEFVSCFAEVPRPDVIVAISGCYYEFQSAQVNGLDPSTWGNEDADVILVAGEEDATCATWQSEQAAAELRSAGYHVELVVLDGASHYAPIFHDNAHDEWVVVPDDPAGEQTVEAILDAIPVELRRP